jgi:hypothetical protein
MKLWLIVLGVLGIHVLNAQSSVKHYVFIEPNISLTYDSTIYNLGSKIVTHSDLTESYPLRYQPLSAFILVEAKNAHANFTVKQQDSLIKESLASQTGEKFNNEGVSKLGKLLNYRNFKGYSVVTKSVKKQIYMVTFYTTKYFEGGTCNIVYTAKRDKPIENIENDFKIYCNLLDGIKTFDESLLSKERQALVNKYTVTVKPSKAVAEGLEIKTKFYGIVKIKEQLEHQVFGVKVPLTLGSKVFLPDSFGNIIIQCNDSQKGNVTKNCDLIVLNSFGKKISIPFTFTYKNG